MDIGVCMETLNVDGHKIQTTRPRVRDSVSGVPNHKEDCPTNNAYHVEFDFISIEGAAHELVTCIGCHATGCYKL